MLLATPRTAYRLDPATGNAPRQLTLPVTPWRLAARGPTVIAINRAGDLGWLDGNGGRTSAPDLDAEPRSLLVTGADGGALVGTSGAHLFRVPAAGEAEQIEAFERIETRPAWHTPWGGPPSLRRLVDTVDGWIYAAIHVGSIVRSADGGVSWEPVGATVNEDVHEIATSRADPDRLYANTANGVYVSFDRGTSWLHRPIPGDQRYGRAIAAHPANPELLLASVSDGPHGDSVRGRVFRSDDTGKSWQPCGGDLPAASPNNIDTHHLAFETNFAAFAAVGEALYRSDDWGEHWTLGWRSPEPIRLLEPVTV